MNIIIGIGIFFMFTMVLRLIFGAVILFTKYAPEKQKEASVWLKIWNVIETALTSIGFVYLFINYYFD